MSPAIAAGITGTLSLFFLALGACLYYRFIKRVVDDCLKDQTHD